MTIIDKFYKKNWGNNFKTEKGILITPYKPEVLFIGTFNHGWLKNVADFFYGRNMYFWPIMSNLFIHNNSKHKKPRNKQNNPSINEIFEICNKSKITFANLIKGISPNITIKKSDKNYILNSHYIWDNYSDFHLNNLVKLEYLESNTLNIINYINSNKELKYIYFTFKSGSWLNKEINKIKEGTSVEVIGSIFTPTAKGLGKNLKSFPSRISTLMHYWLWNNKSKYTNNIKKGYISLDHTWLKKNNVEVDKF